MTPFTDEDNNTPTTEDLKRVLRLEFRGVVNDELVKALREEILNANIRAISLGDMPETERNQAIGEVHGLKMALDLVLDTYQRMLKEDE